MATKTFKIQRTNEPDLVVAGRLVSEATGNRYYVQVVYTESVFVLVVGDYRDGWQMAQQIARYSELLDTLRGFDGSPTPPPVLALLHGRLADVEVRQDLLVTVGAVLRDIG